eukprot:11172952-Alexandrium_andersonii.AAC.1
MGWLQQCCRGLRGCKDGDGLCIVLASCRARPWVTTPRGGRDLLTVAVSGAILCKTQACLRCLLVQG